MGSPSGTAADDAQSPDDTRQRGHSQRNDAGFSGPPECQTAPLSRQFLPLPLLVALAMPAERLGHRRVGGDALGPMKVEVGALGVVGDAVAGMDLRHPLGPHL